MTFRQKIALFTTALLGLLSTFAALLWSGVLTPSVPAGWSQVHAGMERDVVLSLVGKPQQSGWPEKVVETWERSGFVCRHRLLVSYRVEQGSNGHVDSVCEGTWLRGFGWVNPRKEPR